MLPSMKCFFSPQKVMNLESEWDLKKKKTMPKRKKKACTYPEKFVKEEKVLWTYGLFL